MIADYDSTDGLEQDPTRGVIDRDALDNFFLERYSAEAFMNMMSNMFNDIYSSDAGVREGYTVGEHTEMVLEQFDKYFSDEQLPGGLDTNFFRLIIGLHDIGKPQAIAGGDKHTQQHYNADFAARVLEDLGYEQEDVNIAHALLSSDLVGSYIKTTSMGEVDLGNYSEQARELASGLTITTAEYLDLLVILHMSDASSYTEDADSDYVYDESNRSLAFLFDLEETGKRFKYSKEIELKINLFRRATLDNE